MRYIDMHCDTLGSALAQKKETFLELDDTMVDGLRLQQAKAGAQFFAMFLPQRNDPDWFGLQEMPPAEELMRKMYAIFCHTMEQCSDRFAAAHNAEELKQNQDVGKISAFLTIENGALIDGKMDKIREIYNLGVRLVTLTWNDDNCLGHCHSKKPEEMSCGLTGFGKEAVRYMQELGILVDVSHLSDGGFRDVAEASQAKWRAFRGITFQLPGTGAGNAQSYRRDDPRIGRVRRSGGTESGTDLSECGRDG